MRQARREEGCGEGSRVGGCIARVPGSLEAGGEIGVGLEHPLEILARIAFDVDCNIATAATAIGLEMDKGDGLESCVLAADGAVILDKVFVGGVGSAALRTAAEATEAILAVGAGGIEQRIACLALHAGRAVRGSQDLIELERTVGNNEAVLAASRRGCSRLEGVDGGVNSGVDELLLLGSGVEGRWGWSWREWGGGGSGGRWGCEWLVLLLELLESKLCRPCSESVGRFG